MGFSLSLGYVSGVFTLAGCGSSQEVAATLANGNRPIPEPVVLQLRDCGRQGSAPLPLIDGTITFNVYAREEGRVDLVEVKASTLGDPEVEACMVRALQALSLPAFSDP
jgi:hypothetical protein